MPRNIYGFTAPNGVISTKTNELQDISAGKAICSQLETLEKRAIILFLNLFTLVIFMKVDNIHFITLLMLVLNFAF